MHDFALYLTRGSVAYPTTVIIVPNAPPFFIAGALKPKEMEMLLKFFGEADYRSQTIGAFSKTFKPQWK